MREEQRWMLAIGLSLAILFAYQAWFMPDPATPDPATSDTPAAAQEPAPQPDPTPPAARSDTTASEPAPQATTATARQSAPQPPISYVAATLKNELHEIKLRGNEIQHWQLPKHRTSMAKDNRPIDLCTDIPPPCVRFGFAGLGKPDDTTRLSDPSNRYRALWRRQGGTYTAEVVALPNARTQFAFFTKGLPDQARFEPFVEVGHHLEPDASGYVFTGLRYFRAGEMESIDGDDLKPNHLWDGVFEWILWDTKYFGMGVLPPESDVTVRVTSQKLPDDEARGDARLTVATQPRVVGADGDARAEFDIFGGPKEISLLQRVGHNLQESIDFGWTAFMARPLLSMVHFFQRLFGNYGWAIIALTIVIKIVLYPLTRKSYQSMQAMQKMRPKMEELQKKHKKDPQRLNQEMMNLYRSEKVNPLGGCLPMILQIPIFFALYNVLLVSIELRHAPFMLWINDLSSPENLFALTLFGFDLPVRVLPLVMGATMFLQQKLTPTTVDPAQQKIFMLMPIIFTALFYGFPSGLVLYWLTNNVVTITQQWWMMRKADR